MLFSRWSGRAIACNEVVILSDGSQMKDSFLGWKIYCFALAAFLALMYAVVFTTAFRPLLIVDFMITAVSFLGLWGFAFRKPLGWRTFWRVLCFAFPAWDVLFNFGLSPSGGAPVRAIALVLLLFFVPEYWALWKYGYKCPDLWRSGAL